MRNDTAYDFGYAIGQALVIIIPLFVILGLFFAIRNAIRRPAEEAKRRAEEAQAQQQWYAAQEAQARARQQWEYEQRVAEEGRRAAAAAEEEQARAREAIARQRWEHEQRVAEEGRRAAAAAEEEQARAREAMARASMEARARERRLRLIDRFGAEAAERILREELWIGETEEMVQESLGYPDDVDERVMKTKHRRVLKYRPLGKNRYGLRVTLDDGVVVGWEEKGERFG
jgi:hypothetical protein